MKRGDWKKQTGRQACRKSTIKEAEPGQNTSENFLIYCPPSPSSIQLMGE